MYIDSHCHLNMLAEKENLGEILQRAKDANISYIQTICTKIEELDILLKITELQGNYPNIFASVGVHPNEVNPDQITTSEELIKLAKHAKIIGFGETGLDYYYGAATKDNQILAFAEHIKATQEAKLPIIVHTRDAEEDTAAILMENMKNQSFTGLIHCFTASKDFAKKMLDIGFYISFSGIITFKNATDLCEIVKFVPIERILVETDAPYLTPVPMRGKINEPSFVRHVAGKIAEIKSVPLDEVAKITSNNFFRLFNKVSSEPN